MTGVLVSLALAAVICLAVMPAALILLDAWLGHDDDPADDHTPLPFEQEGRR